MTDSRTEARTVQGKPGTYQYYLVASDSMEVPEKMMGFYQKDVGVSQRGFHWPNLGQLEHQNK